jgi:hypothetical protein
VGARVGAPPVPHRPTGLRAGRFGRLDETLQPLLLTPPPEFVAARKAAADELKRAGRKDDAAAIAALRRPAWTDWALNRAAAEEPDVAERFADAADAMRTAQEAAVAGGEADVAGALRALRESSSVFTRAAGRELRTAGRPADAAGLTERLTGVAADPASTAALRAGLLVDPGTGNADPPVARRPTQSERRDEPGESAAVRRRRARDIERLERKLAALDERAVAIELDHRAAEADEADAVAALERARADMAAAEASVGEAQGRRADAEHALAEHRREQHRCRQELLALVPAGEAPTEPPEGANGRRRRRP